MPVIPEEVRHDDGAEVDPPSAVAWQEHSSSELSHRTRAGGPASTCPLIPSSQAIPQLAEAHARSASSAGDPPRAAHFESSESQSVSDAMEGSHEEPSAQHASSAP
jgi:hypothetical protein